MLCSTYKVAQKNGQNNTFLVRPPFYPFSNAHRRG